MKRIPTSVRKQRRSIAPHVLQRLCDRHGVRFQINDPKCAHATVWVSEGHRVEWWPATGRWHDADGKHFGEAKQFVEFVRAACSSPPKHLGVSGLIDEADTATLQREVA